MLGLHGSLSALLHLKIRMSVTIRGQVREYLILYVNLGDVSDVKKSMSVGVLLQIIHFCGLVLTFYSGTFGNIF